MQEQRLRLAPVIDVLHLFVLEGPRIPKADVIAYLHRAIGGRRSTKASSRIRSYERLKNRLRALGVSARTEVDQDGTTHLVIPRAGRQKARVEALLNQRAARAY